MSVMSDQNGPNAGQGTGAGGARDGSRDSGNNDKDKNKRDMDSWSRHYQAMGEAAGKELGGYTGRTPDGAITPDSQSKKMSWGKFFESVGKLLGSVPSALAADPLGVYGTYKGIKGIKDSMPGSVYPADERSRLNGITPGTSQDRAGDNTGSSLAEMQKKAAEKPKPKPAPALKPFDMFTSAPRSPEGYDSTILGGGLSVPRPKKKLLGE